MRSIPFDLMDRYAAWRWNVAWDLNPDAPTYEFERTGERLFVKLAPAGRTVPDEAQKLRWARKWLPVPDVVEYGSDGDTDWLVTAQLPGLDATRHPWASEDPRRLVVTLAEALRAFHEAVAVDECPFEFGVPTAVAHAKARLAAGLIEPLGRHDLTPEQAVRQLAQTAPEQAAEVVCHGDHCLPNVFLTGDRVTGYLDLGGLAIADPWWDLAVGAWSCTWNLGPGHEELFYQAYGMPVDHERIAWYRLLYDLS